MFRALICSSPGGTEHTAIDIFLFTYYVGWLLAALVDEQISARNM
jgi:hypothetical protein